MSDHADAQPGSVVGSRKLLQHLLDRVVEGEILSVLVVIETTSGEYGTLRTQFGDTQKLTGYLHGITTDMSLECIYGGGDDDELLEVEIDESGNIALLDEDEDDEDSEDDD
jgi:hypothetical protein